MKQKHQCALQLQTINMGLDKDNKALLENLFYQNNRNTAAALSEYRRIKGYGKVYFRYGLKNMIQRFELTGDLGIAPGEADAGQLRQKLLKLLLPWLIMLDAKCDLRRLIC